MAPGGDRHPRRPQGEARVRKGALQRGGRGTLAGKGASRVVDEGGVAEGDAQAEVGMVDAGGVWVAVVVLDSSFLLRSFLL